MKWCITSFLCVSMISSVNDIYAADYWYAGSIARFYGDCCNNIDYSVFRDSRVQGVLALAVGVFTIGIGYYKYKVSRVQRADLSHVNQELPKELAALEVQFSPAFYHRFYNVLCEKYNVSQRHITQAWPQPLIEFLKKNEVDAHLNKKLDDIMVRKGLLRYLSLIYTGQMLSLRQDDVREKLDAYYGIMWLPTRTHTRSIFTINGFKNLVFKMTFLSGDSEVKNVVERIEKNFIVKRALKRSDLGEKYTIKVPQEKLYICPKIPGIPYLCTPKVIVVAQKVNGLAQLYKPLVDDTLLLSQEIMKITGMYTLKVYDSDEERPLAANVWLSNNEKKGSKPTILIVDSKRAKGGMLLPFSDFDCVDKWGGILEGLYGFVLKEGTPYMKKVPTKMLGERVITPCGLVAYRKQITYPV